MQEFKYKKTQAIADAFDRHNVCYYATVRDNCEVVSIPVSINNYLTLSIVYMCIDDLSDAGMLTLIIELDEEVAKKIDQISETCRVVNEKTMGYAEFFTNELDIWAYHCFENMDDHNLREAVYENYLQVKDSIFEYLPLFLKILLFDNNLEQCFAEFGLGNSNTLDDSCSFSNPQDETNDHGNYFFSPEIDAAITEIFEEYSNSCLNAGNSNDFVGGEDLTSGNLL